jgi:CHASE2 domain-containing sensor protein
MGVIRRLLTPAFIAALAGGIVFLTPLGSALEQEVGLSWLFKLRGSVAAPASVVVVDIDAQSTIQLEQPSKLRLWNRSLHAELIRNLAQRGAAVIVFDIFFEETTSPSGDQEFAAEIQRSGRVALVQQVQREQVGNLIFDKLIFPATKLSAAAQGLAPFPLPKVRNRYGQFWAFYSDVSYSSTLPVVALQLYVLQSYGYENFLALLQASGYQNIKQLPALVADSNDLQQLVKAWQSDPTRIVAASSENRPMPPVILPSSCFDSLRSLQGDQGARSVLAAHPELLTPVPMKNAAFDLDTQTQLELLNRGQE